MTQIIQRNKTFTADLRVTALFKLTDRCYPKLKNILTTPIPKHEGIFYNLLMVLHNF